MPRATSHRRSPCPTNRKVIPPPPLRRRAARGTAASAGTACAPRPAGRSGPRRSPRTRPSPGRAPRPRPCPAGDEQVAARRTSSERSSTEDRPRRCASRARAPRTRRVCVLDRPRSRPSRSGRACSIASAIVSSRSVTAANEESVSNWVTISENALEERRERHRRLRHDAELHPPLHVHRRHDQQRDELGQVVVAVGEEAEVAGDRDDPLGCCRPRRRGRERRQSRTGRAARIVAIASAVSRVWIRW